MKRINLTLCGVIFFVIIEPTHLYAEGVQQIQQYIVNHTSSAVLVDVCTLSKCYNEAKHHDCPLECNTSFFIRPGQTHLWKGCKVPSTCGYTYSLHGWIYDQFKHKLEGPMPEQEQSDILYLRARWQSGMLTKDGYGKKIYLPSGTEGSLYWSIYGNYYTDKPKISTKNYR